MVLGVWASGLTLSPYVRVRVGLRTSCLSFYKLKIIAREENYFPALIPPFPLTKNIYSHIIIVLGMSPQMSALDGPGNDGAAQLLLKMVLQDQAVPDRNPCSTVNPSIR